MPAEQDPPAATPRSSALDAECRRLLAQLRRRCPHLLPAEPLPPGQPAPVLPATAEQLTTLVGLAAREAAGVDRPTDPDALPEQLIWEDGPDALLLDLSTLAVRVRTGTVTVRIAVTCDQLRGRPSPVDVTFVVGTRDRPAGLLAAAPPAPTGPPVVIARWADELTAFAWQALLDALGSLTAAAGTDRDGTALIPTALTAGPDGLSLQPQARHPMDRVRAGRVVRAGTRAEP